MRFLFYTQLSRQGTTETEENGSETGVKEIKGEMIKKRKKSGQIISKVKIFCDFNLLLQVYGSFLVIDYFVVDNKTDQQYLRRFVLYFFLCNK